ncbi:MAG: regulatory protein RecX [Nitrospirota bacterium]
MSGSASKPPRPSPAAREPVSRLHARRIVLRLLARRAYTEWELSDRLRRRGCGAADAAAALSELKRRGLLDDEATGALWAKSWRDRKRWGPLRIRAELRRRGIGRTLAERILADLFPPDEAPALVEQAAAALSRRPAFRRAAGSGARQARWLTMQLQRRGFPQEAIRRVVFNRCPSAKEDDKIGPHD